MKAKQMITGRGLHWPFRRVRGRFRVEVHQILASGGNPRTLSLTREHIFKAQ